MVFEFVLDLQGSKNCSLEGSRVDDLKATCVVGPGESIIVGIAYPTNPAQPWHVESGFQARDILRGKN